MINFKVILRACVVLFVILGTIDIIFRYDIIPFGETVEVQQVKLPEYCFKVPIQGADEIIINNFEQLQIEYVDVTLSGLFMQGVSPLVTEDNSVSIGYIQSGTFEVSADDIASRGILDRSGKLWILSSSSNESSHSDYVSLQLTANERITSIIEFPNSRCFAVITKLRAEFWDSETLEHIGTLNTNGIIAADINSTGTFLAYLSGDNDSQGPARVTILNLQEADESTLYLDEPLIYIQYCGEGRLCGVTNDGDICTIANSLEHQCFNYKLFDNLTEINGFEFVDNSLLFSSWTGDIVLADLDSGIIKDYIVSDKEPTIIDFRDSVLKVYSSGKS